MTRNRRQEGLTLVEAAVATAIVGVFLAVFVPTFVRSVRVRKVAEAADQLAAMHRGTATYFDATHEEAGVRRRWCLPEAAGPTPLDPSYDPVLVAFDAEETPGSPTWKAIGFHPGPIRYRYRFIPESTGCGIRRDRMQPVVTYMAEGDLDDDGVLSTFERSAAVTHDGLLVPVGALFVRDRVE